MKTNPRSIRLALGMTRVEFADAVGVSRRTVEAYEQGLRGPSPEVLAKMQELLASRRKK
jgi:transcriptional regulator with XRE-family HTH domain